MTERGVKEPYMAPLCNMEPVMAPCQPIVQSYRRIMTATIQRGSTEGLTASKEGAWEQEERRGEREGAMGEQVVGIVASAGAKQRRVTLRQSAKHHVLP